MRTTLTVVLSASLVGALLAGTAAAQAERAKKVPVPAGKARSQQLAKASKCFKPDLVMLGLVLQLDETQVGQPGVEFPHDKVTLRVFVENTGGVKPTGEFSVKIRINRNDFTTAAVDPASSPHGKWIIQISDVFPHGVRRTYDAVLDVPFAQCSTQREEGELTVREALLHGDGRQQSGYPGSVTLGVDTSAWTVFF